MDCLEFRRRLGAEPSSRATDMQAHREQCVACAAAWERAQRFEQTLHGALTDIPVPAGLTEGLLLSQATGQRRRQVRGRRFGLAMAASLLLAITGGGMVWHHLDTHSLPAMAVAHMPDEIQTLQLTRPIGAQAIAADFHARGVSLKGALPNDITYVHKCIVGPYKGVHLVTRQDGESVAVLYLPGKRISSSRNFTRGHWTGREVPLSNGTLVMLTNQGSARPFNTIEQNWRVAIDGLGAQRVTQI